ncbi:PLP-dependent transferase [Streptomyces sp. NPDC058373]|uniref:PLP-dependent transferase n=1 Tax=Streptomyces sp. NPDC058373 TaxID=3346465 RepID=UPI00365402DF
MLTKADRLSEVLTGRARIVFFETPANPTLAVFDIAVLSARARAADGALALVVLPAAAATAYRR